jgi:hypothetical protein
MHRLVWNLAWGTSGEVESDEPDDGEGDIPRGPRVAPGTYTLELEVDGRKQSPETLAVAKDPRSPANQAEFDEQFETSYRIFRDSLACRRALAEIYSVKEQLAKIVVGAGDDEIARSSKELAAKVDALVKGTDGTPGFDAANQELTSALNMAESADRTMPAQGSAVYAEARAASSQRIQEWAALKKGPIDTLNQELKTKGLAPIAIAEIEREVFYLMTR